MAMIHFLASFILASTLNLGPFPNDTHTMLTSVALPAEPSIDPNQQVNIRCEVNASFLTLITTTGKGSVQSTYDVISTFLHVSAGVQVTEPQIEVTSVSFPMSPFVTYQFNEYGTIGVVNPTLNAQLRDGTSAMSLIYLQPSISFIENNAQAQLIGGNVNVEIEVGN